jgi:hypothetical protein
MRLAFGPSANVDIPERKMIQAAHSTARHTLDASLRSSFCDGVVWPVDRASLAALIDLGLSNGQIGKYFAVKQDEVRRLREDYGF